VGLGSSRVRCTVQVKVVEGNHLVPAPDPISDVTQSAPSSGIFSPDGALWCVFRRGSLHCVNEWCLNPNHRGVSKAYEMSDQGWQGEGRAQDYKGPRADD